MKHRSRSTRHKSEFDFRLRTSYFGLHPLSAHPLRFSSVARCTARHSYSCSYNYSLAPVFAVRLPADQGSKDIAPAPFLRLRTNCGCGDGAVEGGLGVATRCAGAGELAFCPLRIDCKIGFPCRIDRRLQAVAWQHGHPCPSHRGAKRGHLRGDLRG